MSAVADSLDKPLKANSWMENCLPLTNKENNLDGNMG